MRVGDTGVKVGRHFIGSSRNIEGSEWGSSSGNSCKYRQVVVQKDSCVSSDVLEG